MRLRTHLLLLLLAALLPVAVFAAITGHLLAQEQQETFRRGAEERTLALLTALDAELEGAIKTIQVLGQSESLAKGDLAKFRFTVQRVLALHPEWTTINVARPDGERLLDPLVPEGEPMPPIQRQEKSFERAVTTQQPVIGDLAVGPTSKRWDYAVRVPIVRDGAVQYVLSAIVEPTAINKLIAEQNLPAGWVGVVLDSTDRIVARTVSTEESRGKPAAPSLREALGRSPSGWFRGSTIEGSSVYTPYRRSPSTGWVFAMGIPADTVEEPLWRAYSLLGAGLLGALALAFALALLIGRRIAEPIASLVSATAAVQGGSWVAVPQTSSVVEISRFARTLQQCLDALRSREEELQSADRHKDEFLAILSHELRSPLTALTTAVHVLRTAGQDDASAAGAQGIIDRQTKHMVRLTEDLLDLTRVRLGKLTLKRETMNLGELVSEVTRLRRETGDFTARASVKVETSPVWIDGDRTRIEQVFSNLLDNALKFTPASGVIEVSVLRSGSQAILRVADDGPGIPEESLAAVFQLFVQGGPREGGLGLGLALVQRLTELHGGSVSATSVGAGKGATFTVSFPAVEAPPRPARLEGASSR